MPDLDRKDFIALLERLAGPDDADVVAAAREITSRMAAAGVSWDDVLTPEEPDDETDVDEYGDDEDFDVDGDEGAGALGGDDEDSSDDAAGPDEDIALINRILAECTVSDETREELGGLRDDIAEGEFTAADRKYLRALYARLAKRRRG